MSPSPLAIETTEKSAAAKRLGGVLLGALALLGAGSSAGSERWLYLGDTAESPAWPAGQVSIDLGSLRQRGKRHEVWERTIYQPEAARQWTWLPTDGPPERRTLWSIRCSRTAMAIVTRGLAGSFEPRIENPQYYVPAPGSADAAVLEATCGLVRKAVATEAPPAEPLPEDQRAAWRILERPPPSFIDMDDEDD